MDREKIANIIHSIDFGDPRDRGRQDLCTEKQAVDRIMALLPKPETMDRFNSMAELKRKYMEQSEELAFHNQWAKDIAKELGCSDASKYRNDAIEGIRRLKEELAKYKKALTDIMKNQEQVAGSLYPISSVYNIAKKALGK